MKAYFALLVACTAATPTQAQRAVTQSEPEHAGLAKQVTLTPQVAKDAGIKTAPAGKVRIATTITLPGEIAGDPNKVARVSSPTLGRVERMEVNEGAEVKKGDIIGVLKVPEIGKVRSGLASATAKAKAARANADRLRDLAEKQVGSQQAALDAEAEASAHEAEARAASEQMAGMGVSVADGAGFELILRSPLAGTVVARSVVVGQSVGANEAVATVAKLDEVWFLGRVFEKDLGRLRAGADASVQLNAYPKQRFGGRVDYIGHQVDPIARTLVARITLKNAGHVLRLGLFGNAHIAVDEASDPVLSVPLTAVVEVAGKPTVFVEQADGVYQRHDVVTGREGVGSVEIDAGLDEGERVVVEGAYSLKAILLKTTMADED